jgi:transposase
MPREYRHIEQYEKKILELREQGLTKREIGEKFGFSKEQIKGVLQRKRRREERLSYGILPKKRGRPPKEQTTQRNTAAELQYQLARKEARIKQLEMENELMRDFLSLTERK